jgi:hypothetical protein
MGVSSEKHGGFLWDHWDVEWDYDGYITYIYINWWISWDFCKMGHQMG